MTTTERISEKRAGVASDETMYYWTYTRGEGMGFYRGRIGMDGILRDTVDADPLLFPNDGGENNPYVDRLFLTSQPAPPTTGITTSSAPTRRLPSALRLGGKTERGAFARPNRYDSQCTWIPWFPRAPFLRSTRRATRLSSITQDRTRGDRLPRPDMPVVCQRFEVVFVPARDQSDEVS